RTRAALNPCFKEPPMVLKQYLLTPGPTPVPERVMLAMARPIVHHRMPAFTAIFNEAAEGLEWGKAVDPQAVKDALDKDDQITAVFSQANESSTGVRHPVEEIAKLTAPR